MGIIYRFLIGVAFIGFTCGLIAYIAKYPMLLFIPLVAFILYAIYSLGAAVLMMFSGDL